MDLHYNIFSVKISDFGQENKEDPFGFDNFSEKVAQTYIPITSTVRKPIYFFFVYYINHLLDTGELKAKSKKEAQLRLEKLLVLSWKRNKVNGNLSGKNILGNSKHDINPFKGKDGNWIIQTCFQIYGSSVNKLIHEKDDFIDKYKKNTQGEIEILNDFLNKEGYLDSKNKAYLDKILDDLSRNKYSLFFGNHLLHSTYKNSFKKKLINAIRKNNKDYYKDIKNFFESTNLLEKEIYKKTIDNRKYPFHDLNKWFSAFIIAVDNDINNKHSVNEWKEVDNLYSITRQKYSKELNEYKAILKQSPKIRCWFEKEGDKYKRKSDFNQAGWDAMLRRAKRKRFYDFRHSALISLLKEIN